MAPVRGSPPRACPNKINAMRLFSQDTKVQALKGAPLFEGLSRKELVELARACEDLEVELGKVLCKEGQIGHEFESRAPAAGSRPRRGIGRASSTWTSTQCLTGGWMDGLSHAGWARR